MAIVLPKFSRRRSSTRVAVEAQPAVNVSLCREDATYECGESLAVSWHVSRITLDKLQSIELSVLWHSMGKGDEDLRVHHFVRLDEDHIRRLGLADDQALTCDLPMTPLSYYGRLINLRWCIRLRLFMTDGREIVTEQPFHLVSHGARERGDAVRSLQRPDTSQQQPTE